MTITTETLLETIYRGGVNGNYSSFKKATKSNSIFF